MKKVNMKVKDYIKLIDNSETWNGHNQVEVSTISNRKLLKLYRKLQKRLVNKDGWLELRYCYSEHLDFELSATIYLNYDDSSLLYCSFEKVIDTGIFKDGQS